MSNVSEEAPEGTVDWKPEFGAEGQRHKENIRAKVEPRIKFNQQLREALNLSPSEFLELAQKDEYKGLPPNVPRNHLTLSKIQDYLDERGGSIAVTITLDGNEFKIPA